MYYIVVEIIVGRAAKRLDRRRDAKAPNAPLP